MKSIASSSATTSQLSSGFSEKLATLVRFVAVGLCLAVGVTGCAGSALTQPNDQSTSQANKDVERSASSVPKMMMCIKNTTPENIELEWAKQMLGDNGKPLPNDRLTALLGPEAFNCAVSWTKPTESGAKNERGQALVNGEEVSLEFNGSFVDFRTSFDASSTRIRKADERETLPISFTPALFVSAKTSFKTEKVRSVTVVPVNLELFTSE